MFRRLLISFLKRTRLDKVVKFFLQKNVNRFYAKLPLKRLEEKKDNLKSLKQFAYYSIDTPASFWEENYNISNKGIPLIEINDQKDVFNPVTIIQYGLACYNSYLETGDEQWKKKFQIQVDALMEQDPHLYYHFDLPNYQLKSPWVSCLAYGTAISLLTRAWLLNKDEKYVKQINLYFELLIKPVKEGGTFRKTQEGLIWLEEYPNEKGSFVYNGFVTTVVGILELKLMVPEVDVPNDLINDLLNSVIATAKYYDLGIWFRYDRVNRKVINEFYMSYHIHQFEHLYLLTKDVNYLGMKKRFKRMYKMKYFLPYLDSYIYS